MGRPPTEDELIERARRGEAHAYAELVRKHQAVALRTALQITGDVADAEEATQDAFVKAYSALDRFHVGEPLRPWLLTIVANEARNCRRSAGRREGLAARAATARTGGLNGHEPLSPDDAALSAERRELVLGALGALREEDREVIAYRHLLDLSERETAAALGWRPGTVKSRLSRALGRLRAELGDKLAIGLSLAVAAAAFLTVSPGARSAILDLLDLQGARIERGDPSVTRDAPPRLGEAVTLAEARRWAAFTPVVPALPALGRPARIGFDPDAAPGGQVALIWKPRPGLSAGPGRDQPALVLTQVIGAAAQVVGKIAPPGTRSERVQVGGRLGYWLAGARHQFSYLTPRGVPRPETARLVGDVLVWEHGRLLLRLEGAASKEAALQIARSVATGGRYTPR